MAWFIPFLIALAFSVVSYMLQPKPKQARPESAKDLEDPVAEAGKPMPQLFGTKVVKGLNVLHSMDKSSRTYQIKA